MATTIFGGRVRAGILTHLALTPGRTFRIRELARRVGAPAPAVLRDLRNLVVMGWVAARRARRGVQYGIRWDAPGYAALAKLILARRVLPGLIRRLRPRAVYLFGSFARGCPRAGSDVDLLIVADTRLPFRARVRNVQAMLSTPVFPRDLVVLTPREVAAERRHPDSLVSEALRTGELLYARAA